MTGAENAKLRLLVFSLSAVLIISAAIASISWVHIAEERSVERERSRLLAAHLETGVRDLIHETKTILSILSYQLSPDLGNCDEALMSAMSEINVSEIYTGIAVLHHSGEVMCSSFVNGSDEQIERKFSFASSLFERYSFLISDFREGDVTSAYILPIALQFRAESMQDYYIAASIDRTAFQAQLNALDMPEYASAFVISAEGEIVAARGKSDLSKWNGNVSQSSLFNRFDSVGLEHFDAVGFDGKTRGFSVRRIETVGRPFFTLVNYDVEAIDTGLFGPANQSRLVIVATIIIACIALLIVTYFLFARALQTLAEVAREVATDLVARGVDDKLSGQLKANVRSTVPRSVQASELLSIIKKALDNRGQELRELGRLANLVTWQAVRRNSMLHFAFEIHRTFAVQSIQNLYEDDWLQMIHASDREDYLQALETLFEQNKPVTTEFRVYVGDEQRFIELRGIVKGELGTYKYLGTLQDISAQKMLQEDLDQSRQFLRIVLDNLGESVIACDASGQLREFNAISREFHGLNLAPVSPDDLASHYSLYKEDGSRLLRIDEIPLLRALGGETFVNERIRIAPKGLPTRIVSVRGQPIYNAQGEKLGAVVVQEDISDLLHVKSKVREKEEEFEGLFEANHDGLVVIDSDFKILLINRAALDLHGYERDELLSKSFTKLIATPLDVDLHVGDSDLLRKELDTETKQGASIPVELIMSQVTLRGKVAYLCIIRDQRERKKVERRLGRLQRMEAMGRLTGGVAHDFNNLLQVIMMNLEMLEDAVSDDDNAKDLLRSASSAAERGGELTQHLLTFTRQQNYRAKVTDINKLITVSKVLFESILARKIQLCFELEDQVLKCNVDASQLEMALSQLLMNADDAMSGSGTIRLVTEGVELHYPKMFNERMLAEGKYCRIAVIDAGVGMSESELEHAFEPFFTTKKVGQNSGLGLSMVYGFVEESGGGINLISTEGKGTTVEIYLPLVS